MKSLIAISLGLSLFITAYFFFEYELPHAQYTKVLSIVHEQGIKNPEVIERIRWSIIGIQTTWRPLIAATVSQNVLLLILVARVWSKNKAAQTGQPRILT